jgi:ferric-dicitrate binding protein FerR (iron transport regulator)
MSEHNDRSQPSGGTPPVDDAVARLVRLAGARPPVPAERTARVEDLVRAAWAESVGVRRRRHTMAWVSSLAAAAALAAAVGLAWHQAVQRAAPAAVGGSVERVAGTVTVGSGAASRPLLAGEQLRAGEVLRTADGGRVALRLAGGPSLRIDTGSRATFTAPARLRLDGGALYVDSQGGPPVIVLTALGTVEERGTQFEVRVAPERVRVRVREGVVQLAAERRAWQALAGAELLLDAHGRMARGTVPLHGADWDWVQEIAPSFHLEGRTLGDFLAWAGRESGSRLAWAEPVRAAAASAVVLHGSIDGLPPDQALAAVLPTCGLASRRDGSSIVIFASSR